MALPRGNGEGEGRRPVLFVHHRNELGGAPTSLSYLIRELDPERFEAHVYCPPGDAAELFRESGAVVHTGAIAGFTHIWASTYRGRRWLLFLRELAHLPLHVVQFGRTLRRHRYALVHLNDSPLIVAAWLARRAGIPIVWHLRSALPGDGSDLRSRLMRRVVRRLADVSIAINDDVAASFDVGAVAVLNSVDLDRFRPRESDAVLAELGLQPDVPVVAYFGFLYPSKGFREFIYAAAHLRDRGVRATYLVVGGAVRNHSFFSTPAGRVLRLLDLVRDYENEAERLVASLNLGDCVRFVPFTRRTERLYAAADLVVAPSQGPEVGRPVIEAAAAGVPVITSGTASGAGVMIPDRTGVVAPGWRAEVIADAIVELLEHPQRRHELGAAARAHAEHAFDARRNARRVEELYDRLLTGPERTRILFIHHRPQLGGAPSSLAHLIRNLDERYEPHVLVPPGPAATLFEEAGARVHHSSIAIFAHVWDNPYAGLRWLVLGRELAALPSHVLRLRSVMQRYRFPIVHLNDSPLLPAAFVVHRMNAKVVWHLRSSLAGGGRDSRSRFIRACIDRLGDAAVAIDRDVARSFDLSLPVRIVPNSAVPPPVAYGHEAAQQQLGLPPGRVVVGYAGFVRRQKGWPELVRAARLLADENLPVHFLVIGGGVRPPEYFRTPRGRILQLTGLLSDEESAIRTLVSELDLADRFTFMPFTRDTDTAYAALDVLAFPNQGAGLGRPVLEAASAGKPVVASGSVDGADLLVPDRTGLLLREGTPEEIAAALARLVRDPELRRRLGAAAAEHARAMFDPKRNARLVEGLYDELLPVPLAAVDSADAA